MSNAHTNYRLDEAQAIMSELRTIKKAICTGEKERQDLMQVKNMLLNDQIVVTYLSFLAWGLHWVYPIPYLNKAVGWPKLIFLFDKLPITSSSKKVSSHCLYCEYKTSSVFHIFS